MFEKHNLQESYVILNNGTCYLKGGYVSSFNSADLDQLEILSRSGYPSEESAKAALRRLKKDSTLHGFASVYCNQPTPDGWEIKKVRFTKTYSIFDI